MRVRREGTDGRRPVRTALVALSFIGIFLLFLFDPATTSFYPPCLFRTVLGMQCPGCGSLRAAHQLLHGNLAAAWELNKAVAAGVPVALFAALLRWRRGRPPREPEITP